MKILLRIWVDLGKCGFIRFVWFKILASLGELESVEIREFLLFAKAKSSKNFLNGYFA